MTSEEEKQRTRMQQASASNKAALQQAVQNNGDVQLLESLRRTDINVDWVEDKIGAELSGIHAVANKRDGSARRDEMLDRNKTERVGAEHDPGRLCRGRTREIAQQVVDRPDRGTRSPLTQDERRQLRAAMRAASSQKSLGEDAKGLDAVTTARAETSVEVEDDEDDKDSVTSRVGGFLG